MSKHTGFEGVDPNNPASIIEAIPRIATGQYGMVLGVLLAYGAWQLYEQMRGPRSKRLAGSAFWAERSHIREAKRLALQDIARSHTGQLSYQLGNLALYDVVTSILTFGAPKSGKSFGITNQAIYAHLMQGNPQVIVDLQYPTQTSLFAPIAQYLGYDPKDIHLFVPGEPTSGRWNIVEHAVGGRSMEMTYLLQANARAEQVREDAFFGPAGRFLTAATMSMCRQIPGLDDILGCKAFLSFDDLPQRLIAQREQLMEIDPWAYEQFAQFLSTAKSDRTAASIAGGAMNLFSLYCSESIAPSITGKTTIPLYLEGKQLLIIGCTSSLRQTVAPLIMALLSLVVSTNAVTGRRDELQIAVDEFPAVRYPKLIEQANELRKFNVFFNLAAQNLNQIRKQFSQEDTENLITAAGTKVWLNPRSNDSAKYLQESLGNRRYRTREYNYGRSGGRSNYGRSSQVRERPLITAHQIQKLKQGTAIVQSRGFQSATEEYIPCKMQLKPDSRYVELSKKAAANWDYTQEQLVKAAASKAVDGYKLLRGYQERAEEILTPPVDPDVEDIVEHVETSNRSRF